MDKNNPYCQRPSVSFNYACKMWAKFIPYKTGQAATWKKPELSNDKVRLNIFVPPDFSMNHDRATNIIFSSILSPSATKTSKF